MAQDASPMGFSCILVPFDFGEPSDRALEIAIELASKFKSKIIVLHVSYLPPPGYIPYTVALEWPTEGLEKSAKAALDDVLSKVKERCPQIEGVVVTGEPWQVILDTAKERNASLIVMGTQGRHGISHLLMGSVAEKVVRTSSIPVLTISSRAREKTPE